MSSEHLRNTFFIMKNEGLKSAMSYDWHETKRQNCFREERIMRDINGLDSAIEYIQGSNRPEEYKQQAVSMMID